MRFLLVDYARSFPCGQSLVECFKTILFSKAKSYNFKDKKGVALSKTSEVGTPNPAIMY